ncbi:hypothetical protein BCV70DRAFT_79996 [Testicularia cyperi]|uniref:Uncharacterized protein n=1 Tax=Testicularia cyperi TaxID=1882483 RepID=A0A317XWT6_9BASI|nr:hypothetical protein BCV70DRAFT_79996 [Testicularia cyperi]
MGSSQQATFDGFISSTFDALLIFEAVRRGNLPKITRRLRDDERKTIRSGTVFVFDEREANIKRWTDGLIWSPSRILGNFLVYREVEKKDPKPPSDQPAFVNSQPGFPLPGPPLDGGSGHHSQHMRSVPLTLSSSGMDANEGQLSLYHQPSSYSSLEMTSSASNPLYNDSEALYAGSSASHVQAAGMVVTAGSASPNASRREAEMDRNIVGSLTNSYPFVKDGLCKKTISIQVEGSTQHLISYYKVDDVHKGRLAIPHYLPELASLSISPIFLNKTNFRYPPVIEYGQDGIPRYIRDSTEAALRPAGHLSNGEESYSSGAESRHDSSSRGSSRAMVVYSPGSTVDSAGLSDAYYRFPHQIGGSGMIPVSASFPSTQNIGAYRGRRASDAQRRRANSRYEPYGQHVQAAANASNHFWSQAGYGQAQGLDFNGQPVHRNHQRPHPVSQRTWAGYTTSGHTASQDSTSFGLGAFGHAGPQASGGEMAQFEGQSNHSSTGMSQSGSNMGGGGMQQPFHMNTSDPALSFSSVPSQPTARPATASFGGLAGSGEGDHSRVEAFGQGVKQESTDPFHFSSRPRSSWDAAQMSQSASQVQPQPQQAPATSQGLPAMSLYSQASFGHHGYDRMGTSPPATSSSHESRQSILTGMPQSATARIDELADTAHPTSAVHSSLQHMDGAPSHSRPVSQAGERYLPDHSSTGLVGSDLRAASGTSSPYPRSPHAATGQTSFSTPNLGSRSITDLHLHQQPHQQAYVQGVYMQSHSQQPHHQQQQQQQQPQQQPQQPQQPPQPQQQPQQHFQHFQIASQHQHIPHLQHHGQQHPHSSISQPQPQQLHPASDPNSASHAGFLPSDSGLTGNASGMPLMKAEPEWRPASAQEITNYPTDSYAQFSSRPGTASGYYAQGDGERSGDPDAPDQRPGFERVMLTRPAT